MPELPEVEVVRKMLEDKLAGSQITEVWSHEVSSFFLSPRARLKSQLLGQSLRCVRRHGKYLLLELEEGGQLLCHLGMTGQLFVEAKSDDPHVHFRLALSGGKQLSFRDPRRFGKLEYLPPGHSCPRLEKLGPDALCISATEFSQGLSRRKLALKTALLDQSLLAGVGNIYADEVLFSCRLHPQLRACELPLESAAQLLRELQKLLRRSIRSGGSTINDYLHPDGKLGGFQNWHQVYGKAGAPCPHCKTPLQRIVLGGRGTHFCPKCQAPNSLPAGSARVRGKSRPLSRDAQKKRR